jgi:hypothetical protein
MAVDTKRIQANLERIRANIAVACARARRDPGEVHLLAVTKAVDLEHIQALLKMGVSDLGENRAQQLEQRADEIAAWLSDGRRGGGIERPRWHMIGHLQRNKVKNVISSVAMIHSVDSLRLAEEIDQRAASAGRTIDVLLQVNCSEEQQKFGVAVGAAVHLGATIADLKNVNLAGLMTMAAASDDPEPSRLPFQRLAEIFQEMRSEKIGGEHFRHLSMGMSQDYMVAVEEGATIVRVGSAIYA